ncbi:MAG: hypothetical protein ACE5K2_01920, partial [Candidatus Zixiibacteriota bacterium]
MRSFIIHLVLALSFLPFAHAQAKIIYVPVDSSTIQGEINRVVNLMFYPDTSNILINHDSTDQVQNEEQIVVNPTDGDNLVAIWRDFRLG